MVDELEKQMFQNIRREIGNAEAQERFPATTELDSILDTVIDATFLKRGFRADRHRHEIMQALQRHGYKIVRL